ncbi:MAG: DNA polymerase/3'-5' exonuclease PolX [Candidatus Woesearchaeota archaeon]
MKNLEVAKLLYDIADMLDILGEAFKPQAYRKAAKSIEGLGEDIEVYYKNGKLEEIPGVGKSISEKIIEFLETGKSSYYEELKKKVPGGVSTLIEIPGMGPKRAMYLYKNLGIKSIEELEDAAKKGKLRELNGFGEKSEQDILKGIEILRKGQERFLLGVALPIAEEIVGRLKTLKEVQKISIAGSLRRMKETIGDLDILVVSNSPEKVMDFFTSMKEVQNIIAKGTTKSSVILKNNLQVDLRVIEDKSFGSALQYFTGSKEHNIALREICKKKNLKLSEYGLFDKNDKMIAGKNEEDIYKKLGMQYIEPELRENTGEIEAALKGELPKLVNYNDIRGDLHIHSKWSDGDDEIRDIAIEAKKLGYEYIAISDHSKSQKIAHGLSYEDLEKRNKEIDSLNEKLPIRILKGMEVDILPDGSLDYDDNILKKLDVVIVSVHSRFKSTKEEMTKRILKALENPYVNILGHPTGRLITSRIEYEVDIEKIIKKAKENNVALEINANPERLDLKDVYVRLAVNSGAKLAIGTDAHSKLHLGFIKLGVATARRGWAEKKNIINTLSLKELKEFLKKKS